MTEAEHDPDCGLAPDHVGDCTTADFTHTKGSRERALQRMRFAIDQFYAFAQIIGNHTFLEFAGLMSAYVTSCQAMHERGIDFMTHHLEIEDHRAGYLGEKLHCIYGDALKKPENWAAFCASLGRFTHAQKTPV
jgi:hypothetical protein